MHDPNTNFNSAYDLQASITKKIIENGKEVMQVMWFEVEPTSAIETRIFDPMACGTSRLKLQVLCRTGEVTSVSFDIEAGMCSVDRESFNQGLGISVPSPAILFI